MTELQKAIINSTTNRVINTSKLVTYDDTRDVAIRVVQYLIDNKYITEFEDENQWDFHIQDVIHDEVNSLLGLKQDEVEQIIITNKIN
tara:strand:+ start:51 stop:314 length:264 start_codon:yes stop_codon:yes gene_type:complete